MFSVLFLIGEDLVRQLLGEFDVVDLTYLLRLMRSNKLSYATITILRALPIE
jgi:hypothetical protein